MITTIRVIMLALTPTTILGILAQCLKSDGDPIESGESINQIGADQKRVAPKATKPGELEKWSFLTECEMMLTVNHAQIWLGVNPCPLHSVVKKEDPHVGNIS